MTNEQAGKVIDYLINNIEQAKDFGTTQFSEICNQIIHYAILQDSILIVVGIVLTTLSIFLSKKALKAMRDYNDSEIFYFLGTVITFITGVPLLIINIIDLMKAIIAPKLYILDYLQHFLK